MKKQIFLVLSAALMLVGCNDNSGIYGLLNDYDIRISQLETLCAKMNTNITSIETIIYASETGDYITAITPIKEGSKEIGYTITFKNATPITIYHGKDGVNGINGADGQNGKDGEGGYTPSIGVRKDTDNIYYWTLDGKWLTDEQGNKMRVTGENGQDGVDGKDGKDGKDGADGKDGQDGNDGANGQDGQDGVTPQLKIENDYWYISYNGGTSWTQLGKAVGADGKDGKNGKDGNDGANGQDGQNGQDGDSMFKSVTYDECTVTFTLSDGTTIVIPRNSTISSHINNIELVDLGLPSGTKWGNQDLYIFDTIFGSSFSYGATLPSTANTETIYINGHEIQTGDSIAGSSYDAATLYYGIGWHIPTEREFRELLANCNRSVCYVQMTDGSIVDGFRYTSKINGRSIQFALYETPSPAMGISVATYSWVGRYWTSTLNRYIELTIKRSYDYNKGGYSEQTSLTWNTGSTWARIRPVFN